MPLDAVKKFRENLKLEGNEDKLKSYREKQKLYNKNHKIKQFTTVESAKIFRKKRNEAQMKCRNLKKQAKVINLQATQKTFFPSSSAKSKALGKIRQSLPKNTDQKNECLACIFSEYNVVQDVKKIPVKKPRKGFLEIENLVVQFFLLDITSKSFPGMKDFVTLKLPDGTKNKLQKRVLLLSLKDAYNEFSTMFPGHKISFSKFCKLRPKNVLLMSTEMHFSCLCSYCENMRYYVEAIKKYFAISAIGFQEFVKLFVCRSDNFKCASELCSECNDHEKIINDLMQDDCLDETVNYKEWRKNDGFMQKLEITGVKVRDVIGIILNKLKHFKFHYFCKIIQQRAFQNVKEMQPADHATIVVDFSENYSTKSQNDIQSSYFGRKQISIFTCVAYVGQSEIENYVIVSDDISHSKEHVYAYLKKIIHNLKTNYSIAHVHMFSDGSSSQFKNRYILSSLLFAKEDFDVSMDWNFFETSHGKSSADGLGGVIKRGVYLRVLSEKWEVYNAKNFVDCAKSFCNNIHVYEILPSEINDAKKHVSERWSKVKVISNTRESHYFAPATRKGFIYTAKTSMLDDLKESNIFK